MRSADYRRNDELRRIQRCWLRAIVVLVAVGVWLGPIGLGGSRLELGAFLAVFVGTSVPVILRALRPSTRLADSMNQLEAQPRSAQHPE